MKYLNLFFAHLVGLYIFIMPVLACGKSNQTGPADSILCYTKVPLTKAQPECTSGNLIADNLLAAARELDGNVQAAVINQGYIGKDYLSPGPVTYSMLKELLPYNNKLMIVELTGNELILLCNHIARKGGWPVSGITFHIKEKTAVSILINDRPVNENIVYKIAVNDYMAYGRGGCDFLKKCTRKKTGMLIREILEKRLRLLHENGSGIDIQLNGRIIFDDE